MATHTGTTRGSAGAPAVATYALILAQLVVWLVIRRFYLPGGAWIEFALRPDAPSLLGFVVSPFVHLEPSHLGINLIVLWLFGTNLERVTGSLRFLALYLGSAWFASLMHWAAATSFHLTPDLAAQDAAIGSSGAVAGVLAAGIVRFPQPRLRMPLLPITFPATPIVVLWLVYTLVWALYTTLKGITAGVGHWAHFAGFVFGLALAQLLGWQYDAREEYLERSGREARNRNDLVGAAQAWSALLAMRPEDLLTRRALVGVRLAMGDSPGARRLVRDGLVAAVRAGHREAAIDAYRETVSLVPDVDLPSGVRYRIGCWLADAGDDELAFRALWESVREDGTTAAAASALYRAGQVAWERLRSPLHAREAWERLIEQFPDSAWSDAARDGLRRVARA